MRYNEEEKNGITKIKQNGVEYTVWTHVNVVRRYIKDDLKKRFPDKLIVKELNKIDSSIPEENLPVEIQSTYVTKGFIYYSEWEDKIRRQIEQNIIPYGKCLFFFDDALLRAMKGASRRISINMDWFRRLIEEGKLEVFTVTYNGIIEPKGYKDFDFLAEISQTCPIAAETDDMILNRNKMKIFANVVKGYGFTQYEIDKFENDYETYREINKIDNKKFWVFLIGQTDERTKLYGNILTL